MANVSLKALFASYKTQNDKVEATRLSLETAMTERSKTVKAILDANGPGPYEFEGKVAKIAKRDSKDENEKVVSTSYFFKDIGGSVQKVE